MRSPERARIGLSLVEVVVALGVASFALLSLAVLLPVGMKTNQASTEEARAADLLTAVEADLRNAPTADGRSPLFGLTAPYVLSSSGRSAFNSAVKVSPTLVAGATTVGLKGDETVVSLASPSPPRYQVSVLYTQVPAAGSLQPIQARLIVNWPGRNSTDPKVLVHPAKVAGHVETYVTFSAP